MDGFRIDFGKLSTQCDNIESYETIMNEIKENVNSIRVGMRHKLSSMDDIGNNLKKIENNLQSEAMIITNMGGVLGSIVEHYRKTEKSILDLKMVAASEKLITPWQDGEKSLEKKVETDKLEKNYGKNTYLKANSENTEKLKQIYAVPDSYKFRGESEVIDENGGIIGNSDEDGYVKDKSTGLDIGRVDKDGIYRDSDGIIRGKRRDCRLSVNHTKSGTIVDLGGYEYEKEHNEDFTIEGVRANSDLIFIEWRRWLEGTKNGISEDLHKKGVPKWLSDRIGDGVMSFFSQESFCEAMHDMIVHGDIEAGSSALVHKVLGGLIPNYSIGKTIKGQLEILLKNYISDFAKKFK